MDSALRFDIADERLTYTGQQTKKIFDADQIIEFNHRHKAVLSNYGISLQSCNIITLSDQINYKSNLGAFRNRQVRQSVILSAALSAAAVGLHGRGSLNNYPADKITADLTNSLKRANDRTAAQVMAEVLQVTTETLPVGEEVLIESTITEGARAKPGKEPGGNPTIAVGAVFGKKDHRSQYGLTMPNDVTLLSMGSDVVEGTTKSVKGLHSSMTAMFVTEANAKRHLPDVYVERWVGGAYFKEFNPREIDLGEAAEIIAKSYGMSGVDKLSTFFLDRPRHLPAMDILNDLGVATPYDKDGDLMPALIIGMDGFQYPNKRGLHAMIGEIGGSAEWAIGVLPLVWRGGQALGMLTSQTVLTDKNMSPEERWKERFHFTEEEFMMIQDARFERKPYFTIWDIIDDPFAGGISAFGAITDNYYLPCMRGVTGHPDQGSFDVDVLMINSLGMVECWQMTYKCNDSLAKSIELMICPKETLYDLRGGKLEKAIGDILSEPYLRKRYRLFFNNEYYPALIPVRDKMVLLHKALDGLVERKALEEWDLEIVKATERLAPEWFINSD